MRDSLPSILQQAGIGSTMQSKKWQQRTMIGLRTFSSGVYVTVLTLIYGVLTSLVSSLLNDLLHTLHLFNQLNFDL